MTTTWLLGDSREKLRELESGSVQCCVTSPPYFGLRNYGNDAQIGMEPTPERYIAGLVDVFREVRRVLRDDGVLWLNIGDCYAGGGRAGKNPEYMARHTEFGKPGRGAEAYGVPIGVPEGTKAKDLIGIPWMLAFALRADGWYLRADLPWVKRAVMPESVQDRPTSAIEHVFMFTKSGRYYYDIVGARVPAVTRSSGNVTRKKNQPKARGDLGSSVPWAGDTRNFRNSDLFLDSIRAIVAGEQGLIVDEAGDPLAIAVNPRPYKGAHFAVFPPALVEPLIRATTSGSKCGACGAPYLRVVEREVASTRQEYAGKHAVVDKQDGQRRLLGSVATARAEGRDHDNPFPAPVTLGWEPSCTCGATSRLCGVLDPFGGAGTTALVASQLERDSIYIDCNPEYLALAKARVEGGSTSALPLSSEPSQVRAPLPPPEPVMEASRPPSTPASFLARLRGA